MTAGANARHWRHLAPAAAIMMAALALASLSWHVNLDRACVVDDTPFLGLCPAPASGAERLAELRTRIAANPGDANAYIQHGWLDTSPSRPRSIEAATRLAPSDPNVLLMGAAAALERQDWAAAIPALVDLTEHRGHNQAAVVLTRLIASGQSHLLTAYIVPGTRWFERVLSQMPQSQGSFSSALPLAALALEKQVLGPDLLSRYITQLKQAGAWADAYSLWVVLHNGTTPVLYNPGFDQPFRTDGFDWEVSSHDRPSKAGAWVERAAYDKRGAVLDIRFTGRAIALPLVQQPLFVGPGRYRVRGEYRATQLRMEQGLAWRVRCTPARGAAPAPASAPAGRSPSLMDTGGSWRSFDFEFSIPANCGLVAHLQLETFAPFEAAVGSRGRASFDALVLEKLER